MNAKERAGRRGNWRRRPADIATRSVWRRLMPLDLATTALAIPCAVGVVGLGGCFSSALDAITMLEPFFLMTAVVLVLLALLPGKRDLVPSRLPRVALAVAALLVPAGLIIPDLLAGWMQPRPDGRGQLTLRLLTQNVWEKNFEITETTAAILRANADVVLLQEVDGPIRDLPKSLAAAYPYRADCTMLTEWCSLAILSKRPILSWTHHEPAWRPPEWDRLSLVRATLDGGAAGPFEIATTHLMHPYGGAASREQAHQFLAAIGDMDIQRGIIAGDFNRPPWSFALRAIDAGIPLSRRTHGLATWPNRLPWGGGRGRWPFPFLPIDQVYAGRQWRVASIERGPRTGSDHYGVLTTLVLSP